MNPDQKQLLEMIGHQLDREVFPSIKNGGFILPGESASSTTVPGKEHYHVSKRKGRSSFEPKSEISRGQREFGRPSRQLTRQGAAGALSSLVDSKLHSYAQRDLSAVCDAYPGTEIWYQEGGFWFRVESRPFPDFDRTFCFLVGINSNRMAVKAWGFSCTAVGASWIGPRHTNFPDGSICAYDPNDGTWTYGDSLVALLDIYSVWALRHLHLEVFNRWPGPQSVPYPYERIIEFKPDELCGCNSQLKRYKDCCMEEDRKRDLLAEFLKFSNIMSWSIRTPPHPICSFVFDRKAVPNLTKYVQPLL